MQWHLLRRSVLLFVRGQNAFRSCWLCTRIKLFHHSKRCLPHANKQVQPRCFFFSIGSQHSLKQNLKKTIFRKSNKRNEFEITGALLRMHDISPSAKLSSKIWGYFFVIFNYRLIRIKPIKANNSDGFYLFNKMLHFTAVGGALTFEEDIRTHL